MAYEEAFETAANMVERVARAICENNHRAIFGTSVSWEGISAETMEHFRSVARAALAAMREPTDAMAYAGSETFGGGHEDETRCYQAMIDAALAEGL